MKDVTINELEKRVKEQQKLITHLKITIVNLKLKQRKK